MKCSICGTGIPVNKITGWDSGNNAEPINSGRCCGACNMMKVIPARLAGLRNGGK